MWRFFLLVLILASAGCSEPAPAAFRNTDISGAQFGHSLATLKNHHGKAVALADFQGKAVIVFFGYTACPDVCPTTLARYAEVMKQIGRYSDHVQVLLVTLDPERDTPEKLAAYVTAFHPSFVGLYGDRPATEAVAKDFKIFFARSPGGAAGMNHEHMHLPEESAGDYLIDHSAGSYVFDPSGKIRLYVKDDSPVDALASDLKLLLAGN